MSPEIKPRSIKVVLANHTRKILSTISASLYEHFSASDFAIRKNWGSSSSCWSRYFSCLFTSFFRRLLRKTSFHHYIYFVVFSVSSVEIAFSSVVILKQFSSGALPPRINCFSSLTRLTSLELTHRRTTFRKHGIWASIPAMMAKQIKTLELQFPMIRFFYNISSSKYAKIHANKLWLSRFLLAVWLSDARCVRIFPPITKLPSIQPTEFKIRKYAYPPALEPGVTAKTKTKIKK